VPDFPVIQFMPINLEIKVSELYGSGTKACDEQLTPPSLPPPGLRHAAFFSGFAVSQA